MPCHRKTSKTNPRSNSLGIKAIEREKLNFPNPSCFCTRPLLPRAQPASFLRCWHKVVAVKAVVSRWGVHRFWFLCFVGGEGSQRASIKLGYNPMIFLVTSRGVCECDSNWVIFFFLPQFQLNCPYSKVDLSWLNDTVNPCPGLYQPICGNNLVTYDNPCILCIESLWVLLGAGRGGGGQRTTKNLSPQQLPSASPTKYKSPKARNLP